MKKSEIGFQAVSQSKSDARIILKWRNDPVTLKMFYHSERKSLNSFYAEFCAEYFKDIRLTPVFAVVDDERIGFLRFNKYNDEKIKDSAVDIDINIDPLWRGRGMGVKIISCATAYLFAKGFEIIVAEIKQINIPSIRAFTKAGFQHFDSFDKKILDSGEIIPIHRFVFGAKIKSMA